MTNVISTDNIISIKATYNSESSQLAFDYALNKELRSDIDTMATDLGHSLCPYATAYQPLKFSMGGGGGVNTLPPDVILAFVSGGALTAIINTIYQVASKFISRHESRELTLERGGIKITLKGRSAEEEIQLIKLLFPELIETNPANQVQKTKDLSKKVQVSLKGQNKMLRSKTSRRK